MNYLITGATGHLGGYIVDEVLKRVPASQVAVSVRDPKKAEHLAQLGVDVRQGDYEDHASLVKTFTGIDRLLLVSADKDNETRIRQHLNAVRAAKEAGVGYIAYTSVTNAKESLLSLAIVHKTTEIAIEETGIPHSFLRNNWYLENEASSIQGAAAGIPWLSSSLNGKVGWTLRKDYAEAAAIVLTENTPHKDIYELAGNLLTQKELADLTSIVLEKPVAFNEVQESEYASVLESAGLPDFVISMVVGIQHDIALHSLEAPYSDLEEVLGHPQTPLEEGIRKILQG